MLSDPVDVVDAGSARAFVRWCVEMIGLGYHPDTRFEDYIDREGHPAFDMTTATRLNELQAVAFDWCDPYEVGAAAFETLLALDQRESQIE